MRQLSDIFVELAERLENDAARSDLGKEIAAEVVHALRESRPPVAPEWLNMEQAAAYLGFPTVKGFRDRMSRPNPPPRYKMGRLNRFSRSEIDDWMRTNPQ